jgi:hypothetical protein
VRLTAVDCDGHQQDNAKHHPPERDDAAALIFEQAPQGTQLMQKTSPWWAAVYLNASRRKIAKSAVG